MSRARCSGVRPTDAHTDGKAGQGDGAAEFLRDHARWGSEMTRNVQLSYRVMMVGLGLGSCARRQCGAVPSATSPSLCSRRRRPPHRGRISHSTHVSARRSLPSRGGSAVAVGIGYVVINWQAAPELEQGAQWSPHCDEDNSSLTRLPGVSRGRSSESLSSALAQPSEQPKQMQAARWCPRQ